MQLRALIMLALALVLGGVTVFLVNTYLKQEKSQLGKVQEIRTVPVVVAAGDLKVGTKLEAVMVKVADWPAEIAPEGAYADANTVLGDKAPVVLQEMKRGEIVLPYKLSPHGARGGLPSRIPEDQRAITIPVSEVTGVAGFIVPGDFVDVLHTTSIGRKDNDPVTRVLLQNVQVLGIDQVMSQDEANPKVVNAVTLLVNTEAAQRVTLALTTGSINLILRNEFDASILAVSDVSSRDLEPYMVEPTKPKVVRRARREVQDAPKPQVEVIRGLQVTRQTVPGATAEPAANEPAQQKPAANE